MEMVRLAVLCVAVLWQGAVCAPCIIPSPPRAVRKCADQLSNDSKALVHFLNKVEATYGNLTIDGDLPSLYTYKAIALFDMRKVSDAIAALEHAVHANAHDVRAWSNLADLLAISGNEMAGNKAYDMVEMLGGRSKLGMRLHRIRWRELEVRTSTEEELYLDCLATLQPAECSKSQATSNVEFVTLNGSAKLKLQQYFTEDSLLPSATPPMRRRAKAASVLRIGFIMALVDGGPVNALMQSLLRHLDRKRVSTVVFILSDDVIVKHGWLAESFALFDEVISLHGLTDHECAIKVADHNIDILFDTNGYTYITGLHIMSHRPSPVQVNFLGEPKSAAVDFFDYYLGDRHANPADTTASHFSEKLAMLPVCYLANSHLEWTPDLLLRPRARKVDLPLLTAQGTVAPLQPVNRTPSLSIKQRTDARLSEANGGPLLPLLLGVFHTYSKFDPSIFAVWTNILRRSPLAGLVFSYSASDPEAMANLVLEGQLHGINAQRLHFLQLTKWFAHLHIKTGLDMYLDTYRKNGHTTTLDAAWAGLPTVALGAQDSVARRSAESILHSAADNTPGLVYSLKEYEDLVVLLTARRRGRERLRAWRTRTERVRVFGELFDSRKYAEVFTRTMQAMHELATMREGPVRVCPGESSGLFVHRNSSFHLF